MYLSKSLILLFASLGVVIALPGVAPDSAALEERNQPSCPGDQTWCGWSKSCKCNNHMQWDDQQKKCHYPAWPKPQCSHGKSAWCGSSQSSYCQYDPHKSQCWNDGHNKVFCSNQHDLHDVLKSKCPDKHEKCPDTQVWDSDQNKCRCRNGQELRGGKCCYPPMPKPSCGHGQKPYCAKNKNDWCGYDQNKDECQDDGKCTTFCSKPGQEQQWCNSHWGS
ncbi:hypothetical protein F5Y15DRAFT_282014 [Xylariaceae sp. FL0016]|nr:hypothetical protein F5Y15DRAFT_282014 [Xylariaceae sp. FL0016]